ncbi:MAG: hypothetical protein BroJett018_34950 [Chloroflexota bacterium]|nr:hypothetical protein [Chloroflexota bacterium]NOG63996.1 hypothetical protein [Chloroflexota bacterium]GIK65701.1 MAG: hypothetical protein BroJett018_34950 [Chloroflexota bacterium]
MKAETIRILEQFENELKSLRKEIRTLETPRVGRKNLQEKAESLALQWINDIHPTLRDRFKLPETVLNEMFDFATRLLKLSRPNNRVSSYNEVIALLLKNYKDRFILPIHQSNNAPKGMVQLDNLIAQLTNIDELNYLSEAIDCAKAGFYRASIVLAWCAVIDRFQRKINALGFDKFNQAAVQVKNQTSGKFKRWNKEFKITTLSELQSVFDNDLIVIFEGGLGLIDSNEGQRLEMLFEYRNQSAHPGNAPIEEPHLIAFFYDTIKIVFTNPRFSL